MEKMGIYGLLAPLKAFGYVSHLTTLGTYLVPFILVGVNLRCYF